MISSPEDLKRGDRRSPDRYTRKALRIHNNRYIRCGNRDLPHGVNIPCGQRLNRFSPDKTTIREHRLLPDHWNII